MIASLRSSKTCKLDDRDPDKAYLEIPNVWKLNPLELARLQLLAKWRQETAMGTKFSPFLCGEIGQPLESSQK